MSRAGFGLIVFLVLGALFLAQNLDEAQAQQLPPGPKALASHTFADAHRFDLVQFFLDFAPGAWTPLHTHGGVGYISVLEGTMTVREQGKTTTYKAGETWIEYPGTAAEVGNPTQARARLFVSFLLPKGAALTLVVPTATAGQALPPGPTPLYQSRFENIKLPAEFDVVQVVLEFAPGAWTPEHTHGGVGYATVVEGSMVVREKGSEKVYKPGESWAEIPGEYAVVGNPGSSRAVIAVTFLLPKGAALTTPR
ncbi:MAG: cupin domain-containing protein [Deinococcota bacterium]